ncbi:MAG: rod shape-determining protein MreC [Candidatus Dadabacteria bacterium]|nr:rod shape-determining protein MreC [Candidatus Dadabacteria bacterium]NIS09092.1 rod shape-determining protein MreC [Candidatus Dadabacteria bacterium]NIV41528.1 rod shape-determining protein MreC [Candidatus Dadabacteria bacterium]NIX15209.1 rod shape-determining protein MreC [Candidatus Dadabacteria bacterium]NIY21853.1 rod shape-determining protein MreC [Candidatus Dadabacteria bacterium]
MGFFRRYPLFVVLIMIFFLVQLVPLNNEDKLSKSRFSKIILTLTYYPQKGINSLSGYIVNKWDKYIDNVDRFEENRKLKKEIAKLREENFRLSETELQNKRLRKLLNFRQDEKHEVIAANTIAISASVIKSQVIIIDKGAENGLVKGMPVKTHEGAVGKIYIAGNNSSEVLLITDSLSAVDAYIMRSRERGVVKGDGAGCIMDYLEKASDIVVGDKVVTSGKDGFFPKGILLGTVVELFSVGGNIKAKVKPNIDINSVEEVLVINKKPREFVLSEQQVVNE